MDDFEKAVKEETKDRTGTAWPDVELIVVGRKYEQECDVGARTDLGNLSASFGPRARHDYLSRHT
jgi:hypothetical protein